MFWQIYPKEAKKFDDIKNGGRAVWNEDEDVWQIPNLHLSGNALAFNDTLGLPRYLMRPETEKAKLMRQTDQNPRWRQDNIINLQLEKPDRSTFDYDFPKSKNKLLAYLETSISDPLEEVKSTPTVEKEFPPNPYMRYKSVSILLDFPDPILPISDAHFSFLAWKRSREETIKESKTIKN